MSRSLRIRGRLLIVARALDAAGLLQRRLDCLDRIGLAQHRGIGVLLGRRLDMTAGGDDEGLAFLEQPVGERPDLLAVLQLHVDDGEVESAVLEPGDRLIHRFAGADNPMAEGLEEVLEHHRDQRLILDDQDRPFAHDQCLSVCFGKEKTKSGPPARPVPKQASPTAYFDCSTSRTVSASSWTENGLARKETLGMSIDLRSCSSA